MATSRVSDLQPNLYTRFENLNICDLKCFGENECNKLHICPQFFYSGMCLYSSDAGECRFGHDIHSSHNLSVLKKLGLDDVEIGVLREKLKLLKKNLSAVHVCEMYNAKHDTCSSSGGDCVAMHICYKCLFETCDGSCSCSHDLNENKCPRVLKYYGINVNGNGMKATLKDFQDLKIYKHVNIPRIFMDYSNVSKIGSGGFSTVYKGNHILDKQEYAIKRIDFRPNKIEDAKKEVEILSRLVHRNIVRYYTCWIERGLPPKVPSEWEELGIDELELSTPSQSESSTGSDQIAKRSLYIQMELCQSEWNTLDDILYNKDKFRLPLSDYFIQLADALDYIHSQGIIHRDLKPNNVFLQQREGNIKLGDFGLAKCLQIVGEGLQQHTAGVGTPSYMSPEMLDEKSYDQSTDIYSFALVAIALVYPLCSMNEWSHVLEKIRETNNAPVLPEGEDYPLPKMRPLLNQMLHIKPEERPSARDILSFTGNQPSKAKLIDD